MFNRLCFGALLFAGLAGTFTGCGTALVDSITVTPNTLNFTGTGGTAQMTAIGTYGHGSNHPSTTQDITDLVTWASDGPEVATVSATGLVTAVGAGTVQITASMNGFTGLISATATATVTIPNSGGGGGSNSSYASLAIIPGSQSVASPTETSQFIAIGTTTAGGTVDLTHSVLWGSSSAQVATITQAGLATGVSQGTTTITAIATNPGGTVVAGTATFTVVGGTTEQVTALSIYPNSQSATAQAQQSQFFVLGTEGSTGLQYDLTSQVVWTSSNLQVATIGTTGNGTPGLATAVGAGTTSITATYTNADTSKVVATGSYSVTIGAAQEPLIGITIVPQQISVGQILDTGQFLAFGTFSTTPTIQDITNGFTHDGFTGYVPVNWISTDPDVFPVNTTGVPGAPAGVVTAFGIGTDIVIAEAINPDGTVVTGQGTFSCPQGQCGEPVNAQLATVTIYNAGENNTNWLVTAPSSSGVPDLIHCGPLSAADGYGTSVCVGNYPVGSTVTLTESPTTNSFGGWSANCEATLDTPNLTPTCTVILTSNETVGVIFN